MSGITKMVEWLENVLKEQKKIIGDNTYALAVKLALDSILTEARRLAAEEAKDNPRRDCVQGGIDEMYSGEAKDKPPAPASLVEELSALEHEQWMAWAMSVSATEIISQERIDRWKKCMVPYAELTEQMKDFDRIWARKAADILSRYRPQPDVVGELKSMVGDLSTALELHDPNNVLIEKADEIIRKVEEGRK